MNTRLVAVGALLIAGIVAVILFMRDRHGSGADSSSQAASQAVHDDSGRTVLYWYDPMMPQQRFDKPGKSPFMDMQLVPKYADEVNASSVQIAPTAQQSLGIRFARAERSSIGNRVTAVGRLEVNERALHAVPSRVSGYVERLQVRAVGDPVKRGELLAQIYSAELLSAQQEFLALRSAANLSDGSELTAAARRRLSLLGLPTNEIEALERSGKAEVRFGVYAPANGFVTEIATREGGQIQSGATLLSIADLSSLWLIAEVPERDATSIRAGDPVHATLTSGLREPIDAQVDVVYPSLNTESRTARVRVVLPNKEGVLRPGMLANVAIESAKGESISVPSEAVIHTGTRSIVILRQGASFRPAEVRVGAEFGERTEILSGLQVGEEVVASGQFLIDSEASLSGVLARLSQVDEQAMRSTVETEQRALDASGLITSRGEVISIDPANRRVTLAHEPIAAFQWPAMTMPFRLADANAVQSLARGDRLQFVLRPQPENGEYIIESFTKESAR